MNQFAYTIRFKIIVVLGANLTLTAAMGVMAILGLATMSIHELLPMDTYR